MSSILIIEDEPDARETLKQLLELEGFTAAGAANGQEGLQLLEKLNSPCLIVLDLMMPVMNGWQFLDALKAQHQEVLRTTPVVVVSAAADIGPAPKELGCQLMKKPIDLDRLLSLARQHCANGCPC